MSHFAPVRDIHASCRRRRHPTNKAVSSARERNRHLVTERAAIRPRRAFGSGDVSLPRARTNDVGVLFATISRDSPTVLSQQPRGLTLAIEYLRGDSTRDRSQLRVCCVPHETIGVCMTLSVCGLGVRNAPSPVVCHAHCPAGAVSVQGKNQTNPYSYITVERRSERTGLGNAKSRTRNANGHRSRIAIGIAVGVPRPAPRCGKVAQVCASSLKCEF